MAQVMLVFQSGLFAVMSFAPITLHTSTAIAGTCAGTMIGASVARSLAAEQSGAGLDQRRLAKGKAITASSRP